MSQQQSPSYFVVTLTKSNGYVFNYRFETLAETRQFLALAALVLQPGDTLSFLHYAYF